MLEVLTAVPKSDGVHMGAVVMMDSHYHLLHEIIEPISKRPISANIVAGLTFQSSKYCLYFCG